MNNETNISQSIHFNGKDSASNGPVNVQITELNDEILFFVEDSFTFKVTKKEFHDIISKCSSVFGKKEAYRSENNDS